MILHDGEKFDLKGRNYSYKNFQSLSKYDMQPLFLIPPGIECEITNSDHQRNSVLSTEKNECRTIILISKKSKLTLSGNITIDHKGEGAGVSVGESSHLIFGGHVTFL